MCVVTSSFFWVDPLLSVELSILCPKISTLISEDDDDDDNEDDMEALMAELDQIRKERAEEKIRKVSFSMCSLYILMFCC